MAQNKSKLFGLIAAGLFLLVGIFTFLKIYSAKISIFGISQSVGGNLLGMEMTLATIAAIVLALVAVCGLVCAFLGKYNYAMIAGCVEFVLFIIVFFVVKGKFNSTMKDMMGSELGGLSSSIASLHISFLGWLHMIFSLAAAALCFLAGKAPKEA